MRRDPRDIITLELSEAQACQLKDAMGDVYGDKALFAFIYEDLRYKLERMSRGVTLP